MTNEGSLQVVVRMPTELFEQLKARAAAEERSMAQTIRYALRRYLNQPGPAAAAEAIRRHEATRR